MNLCSDGHEEVCYEARVCPCCDVLSQKEDEISVLKDDISKLEDEVRNLESQLEDKE